MADPKVLLIPGLLGSNLALGSQIYYGTRSNNRLNAAVRVALGRMNDLGLAADGSSLLQLEPDSIIGHYYEGLHGFLHSNYDTVDCPYDWRMSATRCAEHVQRIIHYQVGHADMVIVAHSYGGIVARMLWRLLATRDRIQKVIFLGTPHAGSLDAGAGLVGAGDTFRTFAALGGWAPQLLDKNVATAAKYLLPLGNWYTKRMAKKAAKDMLRVMATWRSMFTLLPNTDGRFFLAPFWNSIGNPDVVQGTIDQTAADRAALASGNNGGPMEIPPDRVFNLVGTNFETVAETSLAPANPFTSGVKISVDGDGRVTVASAKALPGASSPIVADHSAMVNHPFTHEIIRSIIANLPPPVATSIPDNRFPAGSKSQLEQLYLFGPFPQAAVPQLTQSPPRTFERSAALYPSSCPEKIPV